MFDILFVYNEHLGETSHPRRRRRKTSEGSSSGRGAGQQQSATTDLMTTSATLSLSTKDAESSRTECTQEPPSTVEGLHTAIDDRTQEGSMCTTVLPTAPQVESGPSKSASTREQISTNEKSMEGEGIHSVMHSSAGQMQSTSAGDSQPSPLGMLLTRGNSVATPGTGKTVPRIKKKVAPKVVSSRPKRTPRSAAAGTGKQAPLIILLLLYMSSVMQLLILLPHDPSTYVGLSYDHPHPSGSQNFGCWGVNSKCTYFTSPRPISLTMYMYSM